jgi:hypothetical protein
MSNLYRIPRPLYGILFEGTYCPPGGFVEPYKLVLTHADLWLSDNLSIPLASITNIETLGDEVVRVSFVNVFSNRQEAVDITAAGLLGNTNKKRFGTWPTSCLTCAARRKRSTIS